MFFAQGNGEVSGRRQKQEHIRDGSPCQHCGDEIPHLVRIKFEGYMDLGGSRAETMFRVLAVLFISVVAGLFSAEVNR